jgi:hypothetical protein
MPGELNPVLADVLTRRLRHLIESRKPLRPETAGFWNAVVEGV